MSRHVIAWSLSMAVGLLVVSGGWTPATPLEPENLLVINGHFEGGTYPDGDDQIPVEWKKYETQMGGGGETTVLSVAADNGPSASGVCCLHWVRPNGGSSGDWTAVYQDSLGIDVTHYAAMALVIDVKVFSHDLEAGGWTPERWEYPVTVKVNFHDTSGTPRYWQFGWWDWQEPGNPPPDDISGQVVAGGAGIVLSRHVPAGTWVVQSFSLVYELSKLAEPHTIDQVLVGGSGWSFEGSADNLMICGATPVEEASWTAIKSMFR
jgi:hypothetical protein